MELSINGLVDLTFYSKEGEEVTEHEEKTITELLQEGSYLIGLDNKTVVSLDNFEKVLYTFSIDVGDNIEYEFGEA